MRNNMLMMLSGGVLLFIATCRSLAVKPKSGVLLSRYSAYLNLILFRGTDPCANTGGILRPSGHGLRAP